jgi:hypothetical protein
VVGVGVCGHVVDDDVGALLGQPGGDGPSNAVLAPGPGDQGNLSAEVIHTTPSFYAHAKGRLDGSLPDGLMQTESAAG